MVRTLAPQLCWHRYEASTEYGIEGFEEKRGRKGWSSVCVTSAYDEVCMAKEMSWSLK
jgi:hypothetical protein